MNVLDSGYHSSVGDFRALSGKVRGLRVFESEKFQRVIGQRIRIRHSKGLSLIIQTKDHSSGQVVNEGSKSGLEWSKVVWSVFVYSQTLLLDSILKINF